MQEQDAGIPYQGLPYTERRKLPGPAPIVLPCRYR
jgi:hypothetical protein